MRDRARPYLNTLARYDLLSFLKIVSFCLLSSFTFSGAAFARHSSRWAGYFWRRWLCLWCIRKRSSCRILLLELIRAAEARLDAIISGKIDWFCNRTDTRAWLRRILTWLRSSWNSPIKEMLIGMVTQRYERDVVVLVILFRTLVLYLQRNFLAIDPWTGWNRSIFNYASICHFSRFTLRTIGESCLYWHFFWFVFNFNVPVISILLTNQIFLRFLRILFSFVVSLFSRFRSGLASYSLCSLPW